MRASSGNLTPRSRGREGRSASASPSSWPPGRGRSTRSRWRPTGSSWSGTRCCPSTACRRPSCAWRGRWPSGCSPRSAAATGRGSASRRGRSRW